MAITHEFKNVFWCSESTSCAVAIMDRRVSGIGVMGVGVRVRFERLDNHTLST